MTALEKESFPRVTKAVLYLGQTQSRHFTSDLTEPSAPPLPPNPGPNHSLLPTARRAIHTMTGQPSRSRQCQPNAPFWRSLFNGDTFSDCNSVEIHHFRAAPSSEPEALADI